MTHRKYSLIAAESSHRIYENYRRLLELEKNLIKRNVPQAALRDLEATLDKGILNLQQEEVSYTSLMDGRKSPYYDSLLKTADKIVTLIHSQLNKKAGE